MIFTFIGMASALLSVNSLLQPDSGGIVNLSALTRKEAFFGMIFFNEYGSA
jgi:hypothetical protein